jgi:hypothetical protein
MVVVWSNSAKVELRNAFEYIALDSLPNTQMVSDTLIDLTINLPENPEKHPLDKFKKTMTTPGGLLKNIITAFPIVP